MIDYKQFISLSKSIMPEVTEDKIMSMRMDEAIIQHIGILAKKLGTSKKALLENAVRHYAKKIEAELKFDILTHTLGSWQREEMAADTIRSIKDTTRQSQERYKR